MSWFKYLGRLLTYNTEVSMQRRWCLCAFSTMVGANHGALPSQHVPCLPHCTLVGPPPLPLVYTTIQPQEPPVGFVCVAHLAHLRDLVEDERVA